MKKSLTQQSNAYFDDLIELLRQRKEAVWNEIDEKFISQKLDILPLEGAVIVINDSVERINNVAIETRKSTNPKDIIKSQEKVIRDFRNLLGSHSPYKQVYESQPYGLLDRPGGGSSSNVARPDRMGGMSNVLRYQLPPQLPPNPYSFLQRNQVSRSSIDKVPLPNIIFQSNEHQLLREIISKLGKVQQR